MAHDPSEVLNLGPTRANPRFFFFLGSLRPPSMTFHRATEDATDYQDGARRTNGKLNEAKVENRNDAKEEHHSPR